MEIIIILLLIYGVEEHLVWMNIFKLKMISLTSGGMHDSGVIITYSCGFMPIGFNSYAVILHNT